MANNQSSVTDTFVIQGCILSYPHLFQPQQVQGTGDPKYSAALLVSEKVAGEVYQKALQLAQSHFKNNEYGMPQFQWPMAPANTKQNYASNPRLASLYVINAKAKADYPPQVVDQNRQPVIDRGQIYAGCVVAAGIRLYTYNNMGNIGIGVGLAAIMKTGDGESLGGETIDPDTLFAGVQAQAPAGSMPFPGGMPAQPAPMNFGQPNTPASPGMPAAPFPATQPAVPVPPFMQR